MKYEVDRNGCLHWCISLQRRADRRFVIERTFPTTISRILYFLFATDGQDIPQTKVLVPKTQQMNRTSYAVRFTKIAMLRRFLQLKCNYLCVYEDDVILAPTFESVLETALCQLPNDWEMLFLGGVHAEPPTGNGGFVRCRNTFDNHCILYNRRGAKKVLSLLIHMPTRASWSDREIANAIARGAINAYAPRQFQAWQRCGRSDNAGDRNQGPALYQKFIKTTMSPDDAHVLSAAVSPGDRVLEYGSGGSTIILAEAAGERGKLFTFEHQERWFNFTRENLSKHGLLARADVYFIPPHPRRDADSVWMYLPNQLRDYVRAPVDVACIEPGTIDLVFLDGRARIQCAALAAELLKPGGLLLIHDFWHRQRYRQHLCDLLQDYRYMFETPQAKETDRKGMAVFCRR